ncbi:hypothetical protein ACFOG5_18515 [Pedobacter fastidiosus]
MEDELLQVIEIFLIFDLGLFTDVQSIFHLPSYFLHNLHPF